jgi:3-deoxy-D-manno-octulosonic-acid transferase
MSRLRRPVNTVALRNQVPLPSGEATQLHWADIAYDIVGSALSVLALPFLPVLFLTRHGRGLGERLGRIPAAVRSLRRPLWVHAASVGEVLAAEPLIEHLRRHADGPILVSTTSITGRETARARLAVDGVMLLPVDVRWIVDGVMRTLQPRCLVIVETEIWPALIGAAARRRVPCVIVSGRISERAAARYARIRWLTRAVLARVGACAMQTDADAARIIAMGAPAQRVQVLGSLKFAREAAGADVTARVTMTSLINGRPLLVAASTHPGEEQLVLDACAPLWSEHPRLLLLIAPRRPERFDEVDRLITRSSLQHERRTAVREIVADTTQVLLLDTVGELPNVLAAATAVFVGGTIAPVGGHNVLEPAACGKPVAFGPHTANVAAAAETLLESGAAVRVHDAAELAAEWRRLLERPALAQKMGARGRATITARAAVAERTAALVRRHMAEA